jgi:hypothetical protein
LGNFEHFKALKQNNKHDWHLPTAAAAPPRARATAEAATLEQGLNSLQWESNGSVFLLSNWDSFE